MREGLGREARCIGEECVRGSANEPKRCSLKDGYPLIGDQSIRTSCEHALGEGIHNWGGLEMQVSEHLVRAPAAEKSNDIGIDIGTKEGVGAGSA